MDPAAWEKGPAGSMEGIVHSFSEFVLARNPFLNQIKSEAD
jgi:hypothetical protein